MCDEACQGFPKVLRAVYLMKKQIVGAMTFDKLRKYAEISSGQVIVDNWFEGRV